MPVMLKVIHLALFSVLFLITVSLYGQTYSQQTVDALQTQQIDQNRADIAILMANAQKLTEELTKLRSSVDRFTGVGIGFGVTLTALQGIIALLAFKARK